MNRIVFVLALVVTVATGCDKDKKEDGSKTKPTAGAGTAGRPTAGDDPAPDPVTGGEPDLGFCEVKLEGDVQKTIKQPAGSGAVGTDYWTKPESLEMTVKMLAGEDPEKQKAAVAADPKFFTLLLNCTGEGDLNLNLMPASGTKYADIPFGPKKYPIKNDPKAGEFSILMVFGEGVFELANDGVLEVTKFDNTGIQGTFAFDAVTAMGATQQRLKVTGSFDYKCTGDACAQ